MMTLALAAWLTMSTDGGTACTEGLLGPLVRATQAANQGDVNAWLDVQKKANALVARLNKRGMQTTDSLALQEHLRPCLLEVGVTLRYCEICICWTAGSEGFAQYLVAMPHGAHAEEAYWHSVVEPAGCGDFEGTIEEYRTGILRYETFLQLFPTSRLRPHALRQLALYRGGLAEVLARSRPDGGS